VDVPSVGQVSAANVVDITINRAYIDFPNRDQRQEVSADVAKVAFHALIDGDFGSLRPFGTALFRPRGASSHLLTPMRRRWLRRCVSLAPVAICPTLHSRTR